VNLHGNETRKIWGLQIGEHFIRDLLNPSPDEIDISAIEHRMIEAKRWSNHPKALSVYHHSLLVCELAQTLRSHPNRLDSEVFWWCRFHDHHEGITGDIPGPLKNLIRGETAILEVIETGLDHAICHKLGWPPPSPEVRALVHDYDKQAETIEWRYVLGHDPEPWNYPLDSRLTPDLCRQLLVSTGGWTHA
jgi:hypothetical protein